MACPNIRMDDSTRQALLAWVNGCPLEHEVSSIQDLADCVLLGKLAAFFLQGIPMGEAHDDSDTASSIAGSAEWQAAASKRRRKIIQLVNDCRKLPLVPKNLEGEAGDWALLEAVLVAAVEGPCREEAIHNVMSLGDEDQAVIAALLQSQMAAADDGLDAESHQDVAEDGDDAGDSADRGPAAEQYHITVNSGDVAGSDPPLKDETPAGEGEVDGQVPEAVTARRRASVNSALLDKVKATIRKQGAALKADADDTQADSTSNLSLLAAAASDKKQNDLEMIAEMRSQLRDLRSELKGLHRESEAARQASRQATVSIREARAKVWYEEDIAMQRSEQLVEFEDECRCLDDRVNLLREEFRQDSATNHNDTTAELQHRLNEQTRKCAALRAKRDDLQTRLVNAELGTERMEKQNWRRVALRSKITRLEESRQEKDKRLLGLKGLQFQEEAVAARLRDELEVAQQSLATQGRGMKEIKYLYARCEEGQENAQGRLDSYGEELRVLKKGDVNAMCEELTLRRQMAAQLEQSCGDTHTRSMLAQAQIPLLEELAFQAAGKTEENAEGRRQSFSSTGDPEMAIEKAKCKQIAAELREAKNAMRKQEEQAMKIDFQIGDMGRKLREAEAKAELEIEKMNRADKKAAQEKAERREDASNLPVPSGPMVAKLREQLLLRERELRFREGNAAEVQSYHDREMTLLSGALHQLAIKYGKLLSESEAAEKDEQNYLDDLEEDALEEAGEANS